LAEVLGAGGRRRRRHAQLHHARAGFALRPGRSRRQRRTAQLLFARLHFDLIILDITLPGRNGLEWLSELR
jgi:DNA-binding response OmpR family regulator